MKRNLQRLSKRLLLGLLTALLVIMPISLPLPGGAHYGPQVAQAQSSKTVWNLFSPATRGSGTTNGPTQNVSTANATGCVVYLSVTANPAGTNPTLDVKLQDSPDGTLWFDVPNGSFTQVTSATSVQSIQIARALGNYIRAVAVIGGSASPTFTFQVKAITYFAPAVEVTTSIAGNATFTQWTLAGPNGSTTVFGTNTELLTLSTGGATTDSSANLLPAGAIIDSVQAIVTVAITTATAFGLGDPTTATRFTAAGAAAAALGTRISGIDAMNGNITTTAAGPTQAAAAKVRVTANGTPGAGQVRLVVFYRLFTAPTS